MPAGQRPNPPAHVAHFTILGTIGTGVTWANTFWVRNGNAQQPGLDDFQDIVEDIANIYQNTFLSQLSDQCHLVGCKGLYYGNTGADVAGEVTLDHQGGQGGDILPANVALAVGWSVQAHYRGGHPRTYLAGIPQNKLASVRTFDPGWVGSVVAKAKEFHVNVNGLQKGQFSSSKLGTVSFVLRKQWREPPVFRDYILDQAHADLRVDSMRRRLGRDIPP